MNRETLKKVDAEPMWQDTLTEEFDGERRYEGLTWGECQRILATIPGGGWLQDGISLTPEQERAVSAYHQFHMH
jgi:hypothetical protein